MLKKKSKTFLKYALTCAVQITYKLMNLTVRIHLKFWQIYIYLNGISWQS